MDRSEDQPLRPKRWQNKPPALVGASGRDQWATSATKTRRPSAAYGCDRPADTCRSRGTSTFPLFRASYITPCPLRYSAVSVRSTGAATGPSTQQRVDHLEQRIPASHAPLPRQIGQPPHAGQRRRAEHHQLPSNVPPHRGSSEESSQPSGGPPTNSAYGPAPDSGRALGKRKGAWGRVRHPQWSGDVCRATGGLALPT